MISNKNQNVNIPLTKAVQNVVKVVEIVVTFFHHCLVANCVIHPAIGICNCTRADQRSQDKPTMRAVLESRAKLQVPADTGMLRDLWEGRLFFLLATCYTSNTIL